MVFTMVALWCITGIILISDTKSFNLRWAAALTFTAGVGGLSRVIKDTIEPYLLRHNLFDVKLFNILDSAHSICSFITQNFVPYTFLMFSIYYSNLISKRAKKILTFIFLIPIMYMLFTTPIIPEINISFRIIIIWVIPYIIAGSIILIYSYIKEKNPILKKERALVVILAVIPMIFVCFANYIASAANYRDLFRFNSFIIVIFFISFIVFTSKYGVIGIKIKVEYNKNYDDTIRAINTGAGILAHSIKNELSKISLCAYNIGDNENAKIILKSVNHMRDMVSKINEKIQDINLEKRQHSLDKIITESVELVKPLILDKKINIDKCYNEDAIIDCDIVHIRETLLNILKNSIESIEDSGSIKIYIYKFSKQVTIEITDSGPGIPKEYLKKVVEPFFSTKDRYKNFGLGLSYCYSVMYKHGGTFEINSTEGEGTTVYLNFMQNRKKGIGRWIWKNESE